MHVASGVAVEFIRQRASVFPANADLQRGRQLGIGRQRLAATELEHSCHQRSLVALAIEYRIEALAPPRGVVIGVEKQARGLLGLYPVRRCRPAACSRRGMHPHHCRD